MDKMANIWEGFFSRKRPLLTLNPLKLEERRKFKEPHSVAKYVENKAKLTVRSQCVLRCLKQMTDDKQEEERGREEEGEEDKKKK